MPNVSVIIPTYNRKDYVQEAIDSVLAQTYTDYEIIVVDDGSTDGTGEALRAGYGDRIRYVWQKNQGESVARNRGIDMAQGDYIAFLDSDDMFLPNKLRDQVRYMDAAPEVGMVAGGYMFVDSAGSYLGEVLPWQDKPCLDMRSWLVQCPVIVNAALVRREWLQRIGGFDPTLSKAEDWDLWLRMSHAGCPMVWLEKVVCCYRTHPEQQVRGGRAYTEGWFAVLDKFFARSDLSGAIRGQRDDVYAVGYLVAAAREYGANEVEYAKEDVERALRLAPKLAGSGGEPLLSQLLGWAGHPQCGDAFHYARRVLANLPGSVRLPGKLKRHRLSQVAMATFFLGQAVGDWSAVRKSVYRGIVNDPRWLLNRGVWSIVADAFLGRHVARSLRGLVRFVEGTTKIAL